MPMIQGIDGSVLWAALRQGRSDRASDDKAQAEKAAQTKWKGLVGEYMGAQGGGGVAGQYAPPQPGKPATMADAFNPQAMGQIGAMDDGGAAPGPVVAPQAAPQAPPSPVHRPREEIMREMAFLRPEEAEHIFGALTKMTDNELKMHQQRNDAVGLVAHWIKQEMARNPHADPHQLLEMAIPNLREAGVNDEQIARINLTPEGLRYHQGGAIDYDKMIDNERAERELNMPKVVTPQPGAGAFAYSPGTGKIDTIVAPNDGTHSTGAPVGAGEPPVHVKSIAEAKALPPGTHFIDEHGVERMVPGGGAGNGAGGFPG